MSVTVELFEFQARDFSGTWSTFARVATSDLQVSFDSRTWRPLATERGRIERAQEPEKREIGIIIPAADDIAQMWLPEAPEYPVRVTARRAVDLTVGSGVITVTDAPIFLRDAQITSPVFVEDRCEFRLRSPHISLTQVGPRQRYSRSCRWSLYGPGCTLDRVEWGEGANAEVTGIDPGELSFDDHVFSADFDAFTEGYFAGGMMSITTAEGVFWRQIVRHVAGSPGYVELVDPFPFTVAHNQPVVVFPGCDHSESTCADTFDNILNFGGFRSVSRKNPFTEVL